MQNVAKNQALIWDKVDEKNGQIGPKTWSYGQSDSGIGFYAKNYNRNWSQMVL